MKILLLLILLFSKLRLLIKMILILILFSNFIEVEYDITTKRHINLHGKQVSLPNISEQDWKDIFFGTEKKTSLSHYTLYIPLKMKQK